MSDRASKANIVLVVFLLLAGTVLAGVVWTLASEIRPRPAEAAGIATSLHEAASKGDVAGVKAAIASGADVNAVMRGAGGRSGMTPLICAAYEGNAQTVAALIEAKARVDARADDGRNALMYAAGWGDEACVRAILAARKGAELHRLVNMVVPDGGWTALMFAAASGNAGSIRALIEAGADVEARNKWRQTALMAAARTGDMAKVRALIDAKANVGAQDIDSNSALGVACASEVDAQLVLLLIDAGADVDQADFEGVTPLMKAAHRGDAAHVRVLLDHRASTTATDTNGWTARQWAASRDDDAGRAVMELIDSAGP